MPALQRENFDFMKDNGNLTEDMSSTITEVMIFIQI